MGLYRRFIRVLARNYMVGSGAAVLGFGTLVLFTTVQIPTVEEWRLVFILVCSLCVMLLSEYLVFRRDMRPVRALFTSDKPSMSTIEKAFQQTHRFPLLSVRRILGPHLFGLSLPAVTMTTIGIRIHLLHLPYWYIGLAAIGAVFVACMHALIEFFLTTQALPPILRFAIEQAELVHGEELVVQGKVLITIGRKFQISAFLISTMPLFLFSVAAGVRFGAAHVSVSRSYWQWALSILIVCVAFSVVSAYLLARDVQSPIDYLYSLFGQVQQGDYQTFALDFYSDEFSQLIAGFNHMVQGLKERDERNTQLVESYFATLAAALDARDPYTAGHSLRVAQYSLQIAQLAGLAPDVVSALYRSALLHDIGKIGVPDAVLLRDGKLSDEEFELIKKHPVMGENILKQVEPKEALGPLLPGVRSHHERYDGKGYPDGLAGNNIPLFGRIIAVADAFDAMTSDRPYRNGMPVSKALQILEEGRGSQWDPEFGGLFVDSFGQRMANNLDAVAAAKEVAASSDPVSRCQE